MITTILTSTIDQSSLVKSLGSIAQEVGLSGCSATPSRKRTALGAPKIARGCPGQLRRSENTKNRRHFHAESGKLALPSSPPRRGAGGAGAEPPRRKFQRFWLMMQDFPQHSGARLPCLKLLIGVQARRRRRSGMLQPNDSSRTELSAP